MLVFLILLFLSFFIGRARGWQVYISKPWEDQCLGIQFSNEAKGSGFRCYGIVVPTESGGPSYLELPFYSGKNSSSSGPSEPSCFVP